MIQQKDVFDSINDGIRNGEKFYCECEIEGVQLECPFELEKKYVLCRENENSIKIINQKMECQEYEDNVLFMSYFRNGGKEKIYQRTLV